MIHSPSYQTYQTHIEKEEEEEENGRDEENEEDEDAITYTHSVNVSSVTEQLRSKPDCPGCRQNQRVTHPSVHGNTCHNFASLRERRRTKSEKGRDEKKENTNDSASEEMLKILRYLIWRQDLEDQHNRIVHEWRLLALAIDKVLFWVFLVITVISSLSFLVIIPIQRRGFGFGFA